MIDNTQGTISTSNNLNWAEAATAKANAKLVNYYENPSQIPVVGNAGQTVVNLSGCIHGSDCSAVGRNGVDGAVNSVPLKWWISAPCAYFGCKDAIKEYLHK